VTGRARWVISSYGILVALVLAGVWITLWRSAGPLAPIGAYTTSLNGRTQDQIDNVRLAAQAIQGVVILPGRTFSFNRTVGSWSADAGYKKAPVSFSGELVRDWGGGVCQMSTTLYNAALLAGMEIVERHRHYWPARYVEPGRDAAVAFDNIDLRFSNPYEWPVELSASVCGDRLVARILARHSPGKRYRIVTSVRGIRPPSRVTRLDPERPSGRVRTIVSGAPGCDVEVFRIAESPGRKPSRTLISHDVYPVLHEVVTVGARP